MGREEVTLCLVRGVWVHVAVTDDTETETEAETETEEGKMMEGSDDRTHDEDGRDSDGGGSTVEGEIFVARRGAMVQV